MFNEERKSWAQEMLIREAVENARQGFTVQLKNGARITVPANDSSIDLIIHGLEKSIRGDYERDRLTFIDFMYYWHERLFKLAKRKPRHTP
ncbi:TPA: hypothetical protein NP701_004235 [Klebsiella pneumoniae]|uniref:hypothetical protein n=1 Tax=Klebsiella pneumoniae TaxID=573 RepID=UPI001E39D08B|nr:hypothetical protein [Klebsiella pneumoniae]HBU7951907.1 hypothetical protein [Klebsiella pneumoniae]HBV6315215.1 hypothetical protein [Klebsiella pneumoniae]HBV7275541.1 hypothetical protein [Klebsiella pneumoniae]HBW6303597.1 hypothetical protein [Klebsiella pneumoniae]HCI7976129.1 hypothetical protein [Klebsiella pneumoniae]